MLLMLTTLPQRHTVTLWCRFPLHISLPFLFLPFHSLPRAPSRQFQGLASPILTYTFKPPQLFPFLCFLPVIIPVCFIRSAESNPSAQTFLYLRTNSVLIQDLQGKAILITPHPGASKPWEHWSKAAISPPVPHSNLDRLKTPKGEENQWVSPSLHFMFSCNGHNGNSEAIFGKDPPCFDTITPWPIYTLLMSFTDRSITHW